MSVKITIYLNSNSNNIITTLKVMPDETFTQLRERVWQHVQKQKVTDIDDFHKEKFEFMLQDSDQIIENGCKVERVIQENAAEFSLRMIEQPMKPRNSNTPNNIKHFVSNISKKLSEKLTPKSATRRIQRSEEKKLPILTISHIKTGSPPAFPRRTLIKSAPLRIPSLKPRSKSAGRHRPRSLSLTKPALSEERECLFQPGKMGFAFNGNKIIKVVPGSQADSFGILVGWTILKINDEYIANAHRDILKAIDKTYAAGRPTSICFLTTRLSRNLSPSLQRKRTEEKVFEIPWFASSDELQHYSSLISPYLVTMLPDFYGVIIKYCQATAKVERLADRNCTTTADGMSFRESVRDTRTSYSFFKENSDLEKINLMGNEIGEKAAEGIAQQLKENINITELNLYKNKIGDSGVKLISEALHTNSTLKELKLWKNNIWDTGADAFSKLLLTNSTLTELWLNENHIGDEGAALISHSLKVNTTLTKLDMASNEIKDYGAVSFADAMRTNGTLVFLDLQYNHIGTDGKEALHDAKIMNTSCTTFEF